MSPTLRPATAADIPTIMPIMRQAREYQLRCGAPQWGEGYPGAAVIAADIARGTAVVLCVAGNVAGYAALLTDDPGYRGIALWDDTTPYCAIHRMALSDTYRGHGLGAAFFREIERHVAVWPICELRFDTGLRNRPMQSLAAALGYERLGSALFSWGERLAYRKPIR